MTPGSSLGKYRIVRKLADGNMAEIYLARIGGTGGFEKLVVLKRIRPAMAADRAQLGMFLDEARLAATLRHANIAEVIDVGAEDGSYYFAMEYILGQDARTIRSACEDAARPIPFDVALAIVIGTTSALAYAHDRRGPDGPLGLVHRDVSPSNILVSYDGAVKLVDFGIARATSRTTKTLTGMLKGKVPYMSPEQCRGKVLDRRSDLFSLGIVLYELTTGARPFTGPTEYDTLQQIALGTATPPSAVDPDYSPALEAIVMRLLERSPALRYQTADDVLADLERLGVFVSTLNVRKFMHELFAAEITNASSRTVVVEAET
jgi:serine/threonine protein kinase